jgi:hypothetical protein
VNRIVAWQGFVLQIFSSSAWVADCKARMAPRAGAGKAAWFFR